MLRLKFAIAIYIIALALPPHASAEEPAVPARVFTLDVAEPAETRADVGDTEFPSGAIAETNVLALPMSEDDVE